jgi:hypothetical protein
VGPRLDFNGALHHVIVRGIDRGRIFRGDRDRAECGERLGRASQQGDVAANRTDLEARFSPDTGSADQLRGPAQTMI